MPTSETWIPVLPRVTFSVGLAGRATLERAAPSVVEAGCCRQRGRGRRLGEEVAAIEGGCHLLCLPGVWFRVRTVKSVRVGMTTRQGSRDAADRLQVAPTGEEPSGCRPIADSTRAGCDATIGRFTAEFAAPTCARAAPRDRRRGPRSARVASPEEGASVFTGLVEVLGRIERVVDENAGKRLLLVWPGLDRAAGDRRERRGQRLLPDRRGQRRRAVRGPGGAGDLAPHQPGRPASRRPRQPRAVSPGRRPAGRPFRPGSYRHHGDAPRAAAGRGVGVPGLHARPLLDPPARPQGLDRRRRREPDPGRRLARRVLRHADPPHPGRDHPRAAQARRPGQHRDRYPGQARGEAARASEGSDHGRRTPDPVVPAQPLRPARPLAPAPAGAELPHRPEHPRADRRDGRGWAGPT